MPFIQKLKNNALPIFVFVVGAAIFMFVLHDIITNVQERYRRECTPKTITHNGVSYDTVGRVRVYENSVKFTDTDGKAVTLNGSFVVKDK